jgi:hypothetical protein
MIASSELGINSAKKLWISSAEGRVTTIINGPSQAAPELGAMSSALPDRGDAELLLLPC